MKTKVKFKPILCSWSVLAALLFMTTGSAAARSTTQETCLKVDHIQVTRVDNKLMVMIDIDPRRVNPGRDREVTFSPVVRAGGSTDTLALPALTIAGRNQYYTHLRNGDLEAGDKVYCAGDKEIIAYRAEVPFEPWMERGQIDMCQAVANCCDAPVRGPETPLARLDYVRPTYEPAYRFVELTGDSAIELTAEGRAYIDFIVNRTEIKPTYRKNKTELPKILASINKVKDDPDAIITDITIKGYASPEGSYSNNVRLAMGRTDALKEYVRQYYHFDPELMRTDYEPEDWEGLKAWVEQCDLPHRAEILEIIGSQMEPDPKNSEIQRRYPKEYKLLLDSVYPALRHSDYTIKYRIKTYATVEELLQVYKQTPERMRPVDFQRIAAIYPTGSDTYKEIMLKAVGIHPTDAKSNLNAANIALQAGDFGKADQYLNRAGDSPEAQYTRGVLAGMTGDTDRALMLFKNAATHGFRPAQEQADRLNEIIHRETVEYLIETNN